MEEKQSLNLKKMTEHQTSCFVEINLNDLPPKPKTILQHAGSQKSSWLKKITELVRGTSTFTRCAVGLFLVTVVALTIGLIVNHLLNGRMKMQTEDQGAATKQSGDIAIKKTNVGGANVDSLFTSSVFFDVETTANKGVDIESTAFPITKEKHVPSTTSHTVVSSEVPALAATTTKSSRHTSSERQTSTTKTTTSTTMSKTSRANVNFLLDNFISSATKKPAMASKPSTLTGTQTTIRKTSSTPKVQAFSMPAFISVYSSQDCRRAEQDFIALAEAVETSDYYRFSNVYNFKVVLAEYLTSKPGETSYPTAGTFKKTPQQNFNNIDIDALLLYGSMLKRIYESLAGIKSDMKTKFPTWGKKLKKIQHRIFQLHRGFDEHRKNLINTCQLKPRISIAPDYVFTYQEAKKNPRYSNEESAYIVFEQTEHVIMLIRKELWHRKKCIV